MSNGDVADVVSTEVRDGEVRLAVGDSTDGSGLDHNVAPWGPDGFLSRPNDPDESGAAQVYFVFEGQEKRALGTVDRRSSNRAGQLGEGDRAIVSNCDARFFLKKKTNSIAIYTAKDGQPILLDMNGSKGNCTLLVAGSGGNALLQMSPGQIILGVDGGGSIVIDKGGVHIFGDHFAANTGGGNLGLFKGAPPPLGTNSVLMGVSGSAGTPSAAWVVG